MPKQQNSSTYLGVDGSVMLAKDPRWDIDKILAEKFDFEVFISCLEEEDKTPLPEMLRLAVYEGFFLAVEEFQALIYALDLLPGSVNAPNDRFPQKYLPQGGSKNGKR